TKVASRERHRFRGACPRCSAPELFACEVQCAHGVESGDCVTHADQRNEPANGIESAMIDQPGLLSEAQTRAILTLSLATGYEAEIGTQDFRLAKLECRICTVDLGDVLPELLPRDVRCFRFSRHHAMPDTDQRPVAPRYEQKIPPSACDYRVRIFRV